MKISLSKKILWGLIVAVTPFVGKAQDATQTPLQLTLDKAIEIALSESPTIKIADQEIKRVDYSKKSAWYDILPSLSASGQYAKYLMPATMSFAGMVIELPTDFNANASLQLSLPLFVPALWKSIQMTTLDMQLAVERAHASKITLRNDVTKAYYGVLLAQDAYKIQQNTLTFAEEIYQQAKKRFDVGLGSEFDAISAEVQMKSLQPALLSLENGIEQTKLYLRILMGLEVAQPIEVTGNLVDYEMSINSENNLQNFSLEENTNLKQLDIQKKQLQKVLSMQRTQRMPMLAAFGTYTYAGTGNKAGNNPFTQLPSPASEAWFSQGMLAGVQLNIPLSGIFTNIARERQTKVQMTQLDIQRCYVEESLNLQVRTALDNMTTAKKQVGAAKDNEELAKKGYDIAKKRYDTGVGILLEVQNASIVLSGSQLAIKQAIATYLNSKADLDKILGIEN